MNKENLRRAKRARDALDQYENPDEPREDVLTDLLADLRHYCDRAGLDFAACDRMAYRHYCEEKGLAPEPAPATLSRRVRD